MKLTTTENGIKKLVPENGMFLTDGETIAEGEVWLGKLDSESNWREITPEEKAELEKQIEDNLDKQLDGEHSASWQQSDKPRL